MTEAPSARGPLSKPTTILRLCLARGQGHRSEENYLLLPVGQPLFLFLVLWFLLRFLLLLLLPTLEAEGARNKCATIWQRDATITKCWIVVMDYAVLVARRS